MQKQSAANKNIIGGDKVGDKGLKIYFFREENIMKNNPLFRLMSKHKGNFLNDAGIMKGLLDVD